MADPTRRHLLRILDDAPDVVALDELAGRVGLHVNTVRGHLDVLEGAGLVERTTVPRQSPGRPRVAFRSASDDVSAPASEGYRFLADVLAGSLEATSDAPAQTAREAGRDWGRKVAAHTATDSGPAGPEQVISRVMTAFADLGFAPEARVARATTEIRLHDCPFRALAKVRTEVVCSVHEGLLAGMLEAMDSSLGVDDLQPFAEPSLCVARLSPR